MFDHANLLLRLPPMMVATPYCQMKLLPAICYLMARGFVIVPGKATLLADANGSRYV